MEGDGEWSWSNDLALPHATMRLKQGVGRLIRTKKDVGIVSILDARMTGKQYGRRILECLPGMRIVRSLDGMNTLEDVFGPRISQKETTDSSGAGSGDETVEPMPKKSAKKSGKSAGKRSGKTSGEEPGSGSGSLVKEEKGDYSLSSSESGITSWRINTSEIGEWSTK